MYPTQSTDNQHFDPGNAMAGGDSAVATHGAHDPSQPPPPIARVEAAGVGTGVGGTEAVPKLQKARAWTQGRNASGGGQGKPKGSLLGGSELDRFLLLRGIGKDASALRAGAWNIYTYVKTMIYR